MFLVPGVVCWKFKLEREFGTQKHCLVCVPFLHAAAFWGRAKWDVSDSLSLSYVRCWTTLCETIGMTYSLTRFEIFSWRPFQFQHVFYCCSPNQSKLNCENSTCTDYCLHNILNYAIKYWEILRRDLPVHVPYLWKKRSSKRNQLTQHSNAFHLAAELILLKNQTDLGVHSTVTNRQRQTAAKITQMMSARKRGRLGARCDSRARMRELQGAAAKRAAWTQGQTDRASWCISRFDWFAVIIWTAALSS